MKVERGEDPAVGKPIEKQSLVMRIKESHHFYRVQVQGRTARCDVEAVDMEAAVSYPEDLSQQTGEG